MEGNSKISEPFLVGLLQVRFFRKAQKCKQNNFSAVESSTGDINKNEDGYEFCGRLYGDAKT